MGKGLLGKAGIFIALSGVLLVAGCQSPYTPRERKGQTPQYSQKITYLDKALVRRVLVANHKAYREEDGRLTVKAAFENRKNTRIWADVQVVFYDADKFKVDKTNWQPINFAPKGIKEISLSSMNDKAVDYAILLRKGRKGDN